MIKDYEPSYDELETLFVNNDSLQIIEASLNRFNPIKVMKMEGMEIRHTAILAWLLNPKETHGLGDHFLKSFVSEAIRGDYEKSPNALQVSQSDMRDADVRCEWNDIDIFILSPKNRWAFIIENKVHSRQHKGQLLKYRERIMELFRVQDASDDDNQEVNIRGIFLTLHKEIAEDAEYTSIRYDKICIFLKRYLDQEAYLLTPEVMTFLTHYLHILEELSGMSKERTEMENLARKLYREHKKVLDFIIEHGAGSDFQLAAHRVFGDAVKRGDLVTVDNSQLMFWGLAKNFVSFLPGSWFDALDRNNRVWTGCENWWAGYPVIAWVEVWSADDSARGHLKLVAEVGPISDYQVRLNFIETVKSAARTTNMDRIHFQSNATDEGKQFSKFLRKNTIAVSDVHDTDEMEKKFRQLLVEFEPEIKLIAGIIPQLLDYGKLKE